MAVRIIVSCLILHDFFILHDVECRDKWLMPDNREDIHSNPTLGEQAMADWNVNLRPGFGKRIQLMKSL